MQMTVRRYAIKQAVRHPRRAMKLGLLAARTRHRAGIVIEPARRVATDKRVRAETRRAQDHAMRARRRAAKIGMTRALSDKRVARSMRRASEHASKAASLVVKPKPSHRVRNTVLVVVGAGTASAAAMTGWRMRSTNGNGDGADEPMAAEGTDAEVAAAE